MIDDTDAFGPSPLEKTMSDNPAPPPKLDHFRSPREDELWRATYAAAISAQRGAAVAETCADTAVMKHRDRVAPNAITGRLSPDAFAGIPRNPFDFAGVPQEPQQRVVLRRYIAGVRAELSDMLRSGSPRVIITLADNGFGWNIHGPSTGPVAGPAKPHSEDVSAAVEEVTELLEVLTEGEEVQVLRSVQGYVVNLRPRPASHATFAPAAGDSVQVLGGRFEFVPDRSAAYTPLTSSPNSADFCAKVWTQRGPALAAVRSMFESGETYIAVETGPDGLRLRDRDNVYVPPDVEELPDVLEKFADYVADYPFVTMTCPREGVYEVRGYADAASLRAPPPGPDTPHGGPDLWHTWAVALTGEDSLSDEALRGLISARLGGLRP